eukprot:4951026-Prymnesium_polylepis.2
MRLDIFDTNLLAEAVPILRSLASVFLDVIDVRPQPTSVRAEASSLTAASPWACALLQCRFKAGVEGETTVGKRKYQYTLTGVL